MGVVLVGVVAGAVDRTSVQPHVGRMLPWLLGVLMVIVGASTERPSVTDARASFFAAARSFLFASLALPCVGWAASRLVAGSARLGVLALGFAPAEIASTATVSLAGGNALAAAIALVGAVVFTAAAVGPGLALLSGHAVSGMPLVRTLVGQVMAPFVAGVLFGPAVRRRVSGETLDGVAMIVVAALAGLVASELKIDADLPRIVAVAAAIAAGGYIIGILAGLGLDWPDRISVLLTSGMRDFAVGAAIANTAFGAAATAPAAPYGVIVLVSGTAIATVARRRTGQASSK